MRRAFVAGSTGVGAAALCYAVYLVGIAQIESAVVHIGWGWAAILVLSGLREAARALAWTQTLEGPARLSLRDALRARFAGEALNTLLPMGFVVGEPAKAEHVAPCLPFSTAFSALMMELGFYGVSLLLLFGAGAFSVLPPLAVVSGAIVGGGVVVLTKRAQHVLRPLLEFARRQPHRVWGILALESAYHALAIAEVYLTLTFISPGRPAWTAAVVLESVNRGVTIVFKMLPLRVGIDEASAAMAASRLALGTSTGLMLALVRKLRMLFWSGLGLTLLLVRVHKHSARAYAVVA